MALRIAIAALLGIACDVAIADRWVEYYRTGSPRSHVPGPVDFADVVWDMNEIDVDSVKPNGKFVRYRVRINYAEGGPGGVLEMQADCQDRTRGQLPDPVMRPTYKGTLGGEEVRAACAGQFIR